jgi:hypothetical protein
MGHPELPSAVQTLLREQKGPFLLGSTAPDVQVISGQERQATHFFSVPIKPGVQLPWKRLLQEHPSLIHSNDQHLERDVFIAGYLCHLQADWTWVLEIFLPVFGPARMWGTFQKRLYLHNVLRAYLDEEVINALPLDTPEYLRRTVPENWLPFVQDAYLIRWCNYISNQLQPGADVKTIDVFSARQGIDPEEFQSIIHSESQMQAQIFRQIPRKKLKAYRSRVLKMNLYILQGYLTGRLIKDSQSETDSSRQTYSFDRSDQ